MLIHPSQIDPSHEIYAPPPEDIASARSIVNAYDQALEEGRASINLGGKMVDWAVYRAERDLLAKVDLIECKERSKAERRLKDTP